MSGWRLPQGGRLINRDRALSFRFEGRPLQGFEGDTLASALLARGTAVVARSFKYHRPRGLVAAGWEDPCAFVEMQSPRAEPSVLATVEPLVEGLQARGQHAWPSLRFDFMALADRCSALLPAGFYYKAFKSPAWAWPWFERALRHAAGLGRLPDGAGQSDPSAYERRFVQTDVLVVGAGVAGLWAAHALAQAGARVILADDAPEPGGRGLDRPAGGVVDAWIAQTVASLDAMPHVRRWPSTQVVSRYDHGLCLAIDRSRPGHERLWRIRAPQVLLATGQIERPLLFAHNDRPGIMLAGAVTSYLHRWGVAAGRRMVLATNNDMAWTAAFEAHQAGIEVLAVADLRPQVHPQLTERAGALGLRVELGARVVAAQGRWALRSAVLQLASGQRLSVQADLLAVSGGWTGALALHAQRGGRSHYDATLHGMVPENDDAQVIGAARGAPGTPAALASAVRGAQQVASALGLRLPDLPVPAVPSEPSGFSATDLQHIGKGRVFVDWASDVTLDDLRLAHREGYESPEHLKRYTALGMGPDQGRISALHGAVLMAQLRGLPPGDLGPTRLRPPYTPMPMGVIVGADPGALIRPVRRTPMTDWHEAQGAVMYESGQNWRRPGYYPRSGEGLMQALERECRACREAVAVYDSSPLGKFEIWGPQAVELLEYLYTCRVSDLLPGRGRYAVMLREDGRVFDDGTVFRLSDQRWWITTTSAQAQAVHAALEAALQVHFKGRLEAFVTPVTDQWATLVVCGPRARELLQACDCSVGLARGDFPFMAVREATLAGLPVRLFRVSFTGELSYEIHLPARQALALWVQLIDKGEILGLTAIGSEANHVLRVEKGFISVGHEVDGCVNPLDLGLAWAVRMDKADFVGKRSLERDLQAPAGRPALVGLLVERGEVPLEEGAQILKVDLDMDPRSALAAEQASAGFVTASVWSPSLQRAVALGLLEDGADRQGQTVWVTVTAPSGLARRPARVVPPVFVDPQGGRMRG